VDDRVFGVIPSSSCCLSRLSLCVCVCVYPVFWDSAGSRPTPTDRRSGNGKFPRSSIAWIAVFDGMYGVSPDVLLAKSGKPTGHRC
jgi:hypothetical protein